MTTCRNCGIPTKPGRSTCSRSCGGALGGKKRATMARPTAPAADCCYCRNARMPVVDEFHIGSDGRRFPCRKHAPVIAIVMPTARHPGGKTQPIEQMDVNAVLEAAVRRECAPPWERHPEPWDNVVVRPRPRGAMA